MLKQFSFSAFSNYVRNPWNFLSLSLRESDFLRAFRKCLKTHLFLIDYNWLSFKESFFSFFFLLFLGEGVCGCVCWGWGVSPSSKLLLRVSSAFSSKRLPPQYEPWAHSVGYTSLSVASRISQKQWFDHHHDTSSSARRTGFIGNVTGSMDSSERVVLTFEEAAPLKKKKKLFKTIYVIIIRGLARIGWQCTLSVAAQTTLKCFQRCWCGQPEWKMNQVPKGYVRRTR